MLLSLPNNVWRLIVFAPFLLIIIIIIIITSPRLLSGDVLLFYVSFSLLLLHRPDNSRVMYCYSIFHYYYYYYSSTHFCPLDFSEIPWSNFMKHCRNIICHLKLVTKVPKMLNSLQTSQIFAIMFPVTSTSSGTK